MKFLLAPKTTALLLAIFSLFITTNSIANSCNKGDVDFYLQRGFTNEQVMRLCTGTTAQVQAPRQNTPQVQYTAPINSQNQALRDDQIYLSTALDAKNIKLTPSDLSYEGKECVVYSPFPNNSDLDETLCVNSKVVVNFAGLKIQRTSSGLFLVKDPELIVSGNINRNFLDLNQVRKQERSAIQQLLPLSPKQLNIKVRRGIDPKQVAGKLKKYIRS